LQLREAVEGLLTYERWVFQLTAYPRLFGALGGFIVGNYRRLERVFRALS
jgi:hypothetical protein